METLQIWLTWNGIPPLLTSCFVKFFIFKSFWIYTGMDWKKDCVWNLQFFQNISLLANFVNLLWKSLHKPVLTLPLREICSVLQLNHNTVNYVIITDKYLLNYQIIRILSEKNSQNYRQISVISAKSDYFQLDSAVVKI